MTQRDQIVVILLSSVLIAFVLGIGITIYKKRDAAPLDAPAVESPAPSEPAVPPATTTPDQPAADDDVALTGDEPVDASESAKATEPAAAQEPAAEPALEVEPNLEPELEPEVETEVDPEPAAELEAKVEDETEVVPEPEAGLVPTSEPEPEVETEPAAEPSAEPAADPAADSAADPAADPAAEPTVEPAPAAEPETALESEPTVEQEAALRTHRGVVKDQTGQPIAGAEVFLAAGSSRKATIGKDYASTGTRADERGEFEVSAPSTGTFEISAYAPGHGLPLAPVTVNAGDASAVTIVLSALVAVKGTLSLPAAYGAAISVSASTRAPGFTLDQEGSSPVSAEGEFEISALSMGMADLEIKTETARLMRSMRIDAATIELQAPAPEGAVGIDFGLPEGAEDATVELHIWRDGWRVSHRFRRAAGHIDVPETFGGSGLLLVGYTRIPVQVIAPGSLRVEYPTASIGGIAPLHAGRMIRADRRGASAIESDPSIPGRARVNIALDGTFAIKNLVPGEYDIVLEADSLHAESILQSGVRLAAGQAAKL